MHRDIDELLREHNRDSIVGDDLVALDTGGIDASFLVQAASQLAQAGVETYQQKKSAKESAAEDEKKTQVAISSDQAAVTARAESMYASSVAARNPAYKAKADAAKAAALVAENAQDRAAVGLSDSAKQKRIEAAEKNAARYAKEAVAAADAAAKSPKDASLADKARHANLYTLAAQAVALKAKGQQPPSDTAMVKLAAKPGASLEPAGTSFLATVHAGIPAWGWLAIGAAVATGAALLVRSTLRR